MDSGGTKVDGWRCGNCGDFVPMKQPHTCPMVGSYCPVCGSVHPITTAVCQGEPKEIDPRHIC